MLNLLRFGQYNLRQLLFFLLVVSAVIGPAIQYNHIYLFHLVFFLISAYLLIWDRSFLRERLKFVFLKNRKLALFGPLVLLLFLLWVPFAENQLYALRHLYFLGLGLGLTYLIALLTESKDDIRLLIFAVTLVFGLDLLIGVLESFQLIRWPISRLSELNHLFGLENQLAELIEESDDVDYLLSMPTAFHWNPNDFACLALLGLPFFLLSKRLLISIIGQLLIMILIIEAGSKATFLGALVILVVGSGLFFKRYWKQFTFYLALCSLLSLNANTILFSGNELKADEVKSFTLGSLGLELKKKPKKKVNKSSSEYRVALLKKGVNMFKSHPLLGVGGGNTQHLLEKDGGVGKKNIVNLHFFWLELLVEGGLVLVLILGVWVFNVLLQLFQIIFRTDKRMPTYYLASSILLAMVGLAFSGIGPSSLLSFLPLYLFIGLILSFLLITKDSKSKLNQAAKLE